MPEAKDRPPFQISTIAASLAILGVILGAAFGYGVLNEKVNTNREAICEMKTDLRQTKQMVYEIWMKERE